MNDPRLNSVHLPAPRRELFRQARQLLVSGCSEQTLCGGASAQRPGSSPTIVRHEMAADPRDARFWLRDNEYDYPLKVGLNTIGRSPENDIVVADAYVSRRQCTIVLHRDLRCELFDTASKNGTLLNGHKLNGPTRLEPGDCITLNNRQFVLESRGSDQPQSPEAGGTLGA
jgi:hypothetical protein